jgi:hypothetical protein
VNERNSADFLVLNFLSFRVKEMWKSSGNLR